MSTNLTEGSSPSTPTALLLTPDSSQMVCTETVTFTEVVEGEEWGSFYSSFKVRVLDSAGNTTLIDRTAGTQRTVQVS
jgi:neuropeptide S receptor 1